MGVFQGVEGLGAGAEVVEFREGIDTTVVRKLPGPLKYGDITLKRGFAATRELNADATERDAPLLEEIRISCDRSCRCRSSCCSGVYYG